MVVVGLGVTGRAVARALARRGHEVRLADDAPGPLVHELADELGIPVERPDGTALARLLDGAEALVPAPGLSELHPAFAAAAAAGTPVVGELDLAAAWDPRPCVAITGTDGKTTVTTLVTDMLRASGIAAVEAGNTEVPLVAAIDDPAPEVFVVEASSFRLAPLRRFAPAAGCWLNFGPDHQDVHADLARYEAAKANIWRGFGPDQLAVANRDDPVVVGHAAGLPRVETSGSTPRRPAPATGGPTAPPSAPPRATSSSTGSSCTATCPTTGPTPSPRRRRPAPSAPPRPGWRRPCGPSPGSRTASSWWRRSTASAGTTTPRPPPPTPPWPPSAASRRSC
jgi:UDP-N-acetylmuramoylalanine-D-glutamate ligase